VSEMATLHSGGARCPSHPISTTRRSRGVSPFGTLRAPVIHHMVIGAGSSSTEIPHDDPAFVQQVLNVIGPPLQHLLPLLRVFGNDVHRADALALMAQGLLNDILIEAPLGEQSCAGSPQIVYGERFHLFKSQAL